jgi:modulator of FtsH protease HflC
MKNGALIAVIAVLAVLLFGGVFYTVDETEQVIITQFGKPVGTQITEAGLHVKLPFIQKAQFFPKTLLEWNGDPGQIPTQDKTFIYVETFARWRIKDPLKFYETVYNEIAAQKKLDDILDAAAFNFLSSHHLVEAVRNSNRLLEKDVIASAGLADSVQEQIAIKLGRSGMDRGILEQAKPKLEKLGIELIDMRIKRINYVDEVRQKVYERMIAERKQISEKFRSEGKGESKKIEGDREKELKRIRSDAYRKAQEVKGKADAEAARIYAEAYNKDPEFYSFVKTLDSYRLTLGKDSSLVLSTKSDFLKYLKGYEAKQ